jgi:hypothetical protein
MCGWALSHTKVPMSVIVIAGHDLVIGNLPTRSNTDGVQNDPNANADGRQDRLDQPRLR